MTYQDQKGSVVVAVIAVVAVLAGFVFGALWSKPKVLSPDESGLIGAAGNMLAENYDPYVQYNGGYNSAKDIVTSADLKTTGTFTMSGVATMSGTWVASGAVSNTSTWTLGSSGTALTQANQGNCSVVAYAATITATSTAQVDCSSNGTPSGTLTGITSTSNVFVHATSSLSALTAGLGGVVITSSRASSTAGIITLTVLNLTGSTFTWTAAASTSPQYWVIK